MNASADRTEMTVKFAQQSDGNGARHQDTRNSVYMNLYKDAPALALEILRNGWQIVGYSGDRTSIARLTHAKDGSGRDAA